MKKFCLILIALGFVAACNTEQDPLKERSEDVRQGVPPKFKVKEDRPPCRPDSILLDVYPPVQMFAEGLEREIKFKARAVSCDIQNFNIVLENKPDGAEFESNNDSAKLVWTPPEFTIGGDKYFDDFVLRLKVYSVADTTSFRDISVPYYVTRQAPKKPEILDYTIDKSEIVEGGKGLLKVRIKDPDSHDGRPGSGQAPQMNLITTDSDDRNGIRYVEFRGWNNPKIDANDPEIWHFDINIDTRGQNVVDRDMTLRFAVFAVSRYGVPSEPFNLEYNIRNRVGEPAISWPKSHELEFKKGFKNSHSFWVYDPREEGQVRAKIENVCENLNGNPQCKCKAINDLRHREEGSICTIEWDVPQQITLTELVLPIDVVNTNFDDPTDYIEKRHNRKINIVEPGVQ